MNMTKVFYQGNEYPMPAGVTQSQIVDILRDLGNTEITNQNANFENYAQDGIPCVRVTVRQGTKG